MTDTIDVWRVRPNRRAGDIAALSTILPAEELARIRRPGDPARERAAIISRAVLRLLLARYTRVPADELRLIVGKNGKPHLDSSQNEQGFTFNFSDSADMALVAVTINREVGVDVEQVREVERAAELAARHFPPESSAELVRASESDRSRVFLQHWARHEALLKARSGSIWNPAGEKSLTLPDTQSYVPTGAVFTVRDLDTGYDHVGALAAQGDGWAVEVKDYSD